MTEKKPTGNNPENMKHNCDVCGEPAVIRQSDGHYYCYDHHMKYCRGSTFEVMKLDKKMPEDTTSIF